MAFHPQAAELAHQIEEALFALHGGTVGAYRQHARSLLFNIKDGKNERLRGRLLTGLAAQELVRLKPADLANEELANSVYHHGEVEIVKPGLVVKKTHKGEAAVGQGEDVTEEGETMTRVPLLPPLLDNVADKPTFKLADHAVSKLADNAVSKLADEPANKLADSREGLVLFPELCCFPFKIVMEEESPLIRSLPHNLHLTGRIAPSKVLDYLQSLGPTRWILIPLQIVNEDSAEREKFVNYLHTQQRWAVMVATPGTPIKDLYLVDPAMAPSLSTSHASGLHLIIVTK